jgi:hypothetical protein
MIISIHQPAYLPWLGYFDKINRSDIFIYLDTVQLEKNSYSYTYRNKIKTPQGSTWLTVPLKTKGHTAKSIGDIRIDNSRNWKKKHLKNIFFNYKKAKFFDEVYPKIALLFEVSILTLQICGCSAALPNSSNTYDEEQTVSLTVNEYTPAPTFEIKSTVSPFDHLYWYVESIGETRIET